MPEEPRAGIRPYYWEAPSEIWSGLEESARVTGRSISDEIAVAVRHWLTLDVRKRTATKSVKRKRGRPKKEGDHDVRPQS